MKIDSMDGLPTKIIMMKFYVGQTLQQLNEEYGGAGDVSLISAKLRLFPITNTTFGGWVQQMKTDWEEETAIWNDYLEGGKNGNENEHLLPYNNEKDVMGEFGKVLAEEWVEVDLTDGLIGIIENANNGVGVGVGVGDGAGAGAGAGVAAADDDIDNISNGGKALALRITTDDTDGVIYLSKEAPGERGPQLILQFSIGLESQGGIDNEESSVDGETINGNSTGLEAAVPSASPTVSITYEPTTGTSTTPKPTEFVTSAIPTVGPVVSSTTSTTIAATSTSSTTTTVEFGKTDLPTATPTLASSVADSDNSTLSPTQPLTSINQTIVPTIAPTVSPMETSTSPTLSTQEDTDAPTITVGKTSTVNPTSASSGSETNVPTMTPVESFTASPISNNPGVESDAPTVAPVDISTTSPSVLNEISQSTSTFPTDAPTTYAPTYNTPTKSPSTSIADEESTMKSTSIVSSSFRMTISAIEKKLNQRRLREDSSQFDAESRDRGLVTFMSIDDKERPAIKQHLEKVFKDVLSIVPDDISLAFEDQVVVEILAPSEDDNGGVLRQSTFRVIGLFDSDKLAGIPTAEAASVLDQATLYAFVNAEKYEFLSILERTGEPILSKTAEYDVTVTKVNFSVGTDGTDSNSLGAANEDANANANALAENEEDNNSSWVQPALISGAALLVAATSGAALILLRQRRCENLDFEKKPNDSPRSAADTAPNTPSPGMFIDRWKKSRFDYAEFEDDPDLEEPSTVSIGPDSPLQSTSKYLSSPPDNRPQDIKFSQFMNTSFDDSSVSDVSAHILGAKGVKKADTAVKSDDQSSSQAGSFLLDTTMDSYNMEAMSALDQVRFENVIQIEGGSPNHIPMYPPRVMYDDESMSTGDVPSELYSNLSLDSSTMQSYDTGAYGGHLFALDMIKNKDSSLLVMPPPPSDAASDTSSRKDPQQLSVESDSDSIFDEKTEDDGYGDMPPNFATSADQVEREVQNHHGAQDIVSQSINEELTKVMALLRNSSDDDDDPDVFDIQESHYDSGIFREDDSHDNNINKTEVLSSVSKLSETVDTSEDNLATLEPVQKNEQPMLCTSKDSATAHNEPVDDDDLTTKSTEPQNKTDSYDGFNVLIDDTSTDAEPDENDPLKLMNNTLSDCMEILGKARQCKSPYSKDSETE